MNSRPLFALGLALACTSFLQSQPKKQDALPKALLLARYVYVEAVDGDAFNLSLLSEDREAIANVEDALRGWHRYNVTLKRKDAELLFVVRKGRIVDAQGRVGGGRSQGSKQSEERPSPGLEAEVGSPDDLLNVYIVNADGSLQGPIWKQYSKDGLNAPVMPLFNEFKDAVELAARQTSAKQAHP